MEGQDTGSPWTCPAQCWECVCVDWMALAQHVSMHPAQMVSSWTATMWSILGWCLHRKF